MGKKVRALKPKEEHEEQSAIDQTTLVLKLSYVADGLGSLGEIMTTGCVEERRVTGIGFLVICLAEYLHERVNEVEAM